MPHTSSRSRTLAYAPDMHRPVVAIAAAERIASPAAGGIGGQVRDLRIRRGMSREDLAARAGPSVRTIRHVESGRAGTPRPGTLRLLCGALGLAGTVQDDRQTAALSLGLTAAAQAAIACGGGRSAIPASGIGRVPGHHHPRLAVLVHAVACGGGERIHPRSRGPGGMLPSRAAE